jgi:hypothetical protein
MPFQILRHVNFLEAMTAKLATAHPSNEMDCEQLYCQSAKVDAF